MEQIKFFKKATEPENLVKGNIWFDTTTKSIKVKTDTGFDVFGIGLKQAELVDNKLVITRADDTTVTVDFNDIASAKSVANALDKKVDKVEGKVLSTNDYTTADKDKLASITTGAQVNIIESVSVNGTPLVVTDKAIDITVPAATVTGVDSEDKILSLNEKLVKSEVGLAYDSETKKINLTGKAGAIIASIDATSFIKDGMLQSAELVVNPEEQTAGTYLLLTFNTDSGSDPIYVNVTSLIDVYTPGNGITITGKSIAIDNNVINNLVNTNITALNKEDTPVAGKVVSAVSQTDGVITVSRRALEADDIPSITVAKLSDLDATKVDLSADYSAATIYAAPAVGDNIETAISKLAKGVADATAAGVTSFGGKTGAITVRGSQTGTAVNLTMVDNELQATVIGVATTDQGSKADTALQTISAAGSDYLSLSTNTKENNTQEISGSLTVQTIANASNSNKGLVEANDAKTYIDSAIESMMMWTEFE